MVDELTKRWSGHDLALVPVTNQVAAGADLVVLATPVEGAVTTVRTLADELAGKIMVTMVNAMVKWGDRFVPLVAATPARWRWRCPGWSPPPTWPAPFTTFPPALWVTLHHQLEADVMVFSD